MSIVGDGSGRSNSLVERVKGILLKPNEEWGRIDVEPATIQGIYTGYACILAAIPAVASFIGGQLFGYNMLLVRYRPTLVSGVVDAVVSYVLSLVMVFVLALVIEALAPSFDGVKDRVQAFKVAVYASTAGWVAGAVGLLVGLAPAIGIVGLIGSLYGLYLIYLGLPKLMKAPQEKALGYTAVTIVVAIVLFVVIGAVTRGVSGAAMLGGGIAPGVASAPAGGEISFGGTKVDLGKLEQASKQMEASAKQLEASVSGVAPGGTGAVQAVPGETLKALLPEVGGYTRSEISSESGGVGGFSGSKAEAKYEKGPSSITVEIVDMGAAGGLAGLAGAFQVQANKETETGYEKVSTVNGRITSEEYDRQAKRGKYGVMVASRFMVEARGDEVAMNDLKGVVGAVDIGRLEALAK